GVRRSRAWPGDRGRHPEGQEGRQRQSLGTHRDDGHSKGEPMNAKTSLLGLCGMMLVGLSACFAGSADMLQENESQVMEFRRQIDQLKLQVKTKDEETKRLMQELEKVKKVEAQILGLEERLRAMDDLVMTKSEQIANLESQLAGAKEAAEAAAAAAAAAPHGTSPACTALRRTHVGEGGAGEGRGHGEGGHARADRLLRGETAGA